MKAIVNIKLLMVISLCILCGSCEYFVEVEVPNHKIVSETIFEEDETATRAMKGIYNELFNASFSGGWSSSITVLAGLSSDILEPVNSENITYGEFHKNEISPDHSSNFNLWSSAYNIIYMTNSMLEGLATSENLSADLRQRLEGEARFVRAFTYFYLTNLYGDVPLVVDTDYRINSLVARDSAGDVYGQVVADLERAMDLLPTEYDVSDRTTVNRFTAIALRARMALYQQNWEQAEALSSEIINQSSGYEILQDLNNVFLANSREAIWQISPIGRGNILTSTGEGQVFIGTSRSSLRLANDFVENMDPQDKRLNHWVGHFSNESRNFFFPYKYKDFSSLNNITEYSMVLRLAEQYLIRAEARAMLGDLEGAISDLDKIRNRAGLEELAVINPGIGKEELLQLIMEERKQELFAEWGHRWFDLKRTGRANEILKDKTSLWNDTDVFYPIPEAERMKNPNLGQNPGY